MRSGPLYWHGSSGRNDAQSRARSSHISMPSLCKSVYSRFLLHYLPVRAYWRQFRSTRAGTWAICMHPLRRGDLTRQMPHFKSRNFLAAAINLVRTFKNSGRVLNCRLTRGKRSYRLALYASEFLNGDTGSLNPASASTLVTPA